MLFMKRSTKIWIFFSNQTIKSMKLPFIKPRSNKSSEKQRKVRKIFKTRDH